MAKICCRCNIKKPLNLFNRDKSIEDGFAITCKKCRAESFEKRKQENPESIQAYRKKYREENAEVIADKAHRYRHGIGKQEVLDMLAKQNGCKLCGIDTPGGMGYWHIDHDHKCCGPRKSCEKCRRGILCNACNLMLGMAKDNIETLKMAIRYLEEYERTKI